MKIGFKTLLNEQSQRYKFINWQDHHWNLLFNKSHFCSQKEKRFAQILTYFRYRKSDLLVIDISKEKNVSKIVDFLALPQFIDFSMPHTYNTKSIKKSSKPQLSNFAKLKRQSITLDYINNELID